MAQRLTSLQMSLQMDALSESKGNSRSTTFHDNLKLPLHRWYRYSAGFSAEWCRELLEHQYLLGKRKVLDPFAGSGTVLIEAEHLGFKALGVEAHPFIARVARAKLQWRSSPSDFRDFALELLSKAERTHSTSIGGYPPLVQKCFTETNLGELDRLHTAWLSTASNSANSEIAWLALASIIRESASVATAQWQYVLPKKPKLRCISPFRAFKDKVELITRDMTYRQSLSMGSSAELRWADARDLTSLPQEWADLVITSPPYANNYDYADATRLEMSFFREIVGWGDLQDSVRKYLVRSCTQHAAQLNGRTSQILSDPLLQPIARDIVEVCRRLEAERTLHGGKKTYHAMIAAYFLDLAEVFRELRSVCKDGSLMCFVVGDSAPYGIHVPVDGWLGELAVGSGFKSYEFEKTRDRNIKWKNRKHTVPLHEGRLWIKG